MEEVGIATNMLSHKISKIEIVAWGFNYILQTKCFETTIYIKKW